MVGEAQEKNVIAVLLQDHERIRLLFARVQEARYADRRIEAAHELATLLVQHSAAEEMHLYPEIRDSVPGGAALADEGLAEHTAMEHLLKRWLTLGGDNPEFMDVLDLLNTEVLSHLSAEETEIFPELERQVPVERLHELALRVEQSEKIGPTRPHPHGPHKPPVNKLVGPGVGLMDRLRDRLH